MTEKFSKFDMYKSNTSMNLNQGKYQENHTKRCHN